MTALRRGILSPLAVRSVLVLLASSAPLLLPAFLLSPLAPHQQTSTCFLGEAPAAAVGARPSAASSGTARKRCHATSNGKNAHAISASAMVAGYRCRQAYGAAPSVRTTRTTSSSSGSGGRSLLVLGARGGGRSRGDSSRRRTDRPDEYSSDRKKGKRKGGSGGRGGRSGGRGGGGGSSGSSSSSGIGISSGAPSPFEQLADGELWGGESRLSTLDDRVPAEFSRKIDCSELSRKPKFFSVEATEKECAALAERFSCETITGLKADFRVVRAAGSESRKIKIRGRVNGRVTQNCAATLEPFELPVEREFTTVIQEVSLDSVESTLWALEKDTDTDDEIMEGDPLDLGEVAAQMLALCIDPYAKHPDLVSRLDAEIDGGGSAGDWAGNEGFAAGRFGMPAEGEDVVLDVETMRAFFDAED